MDQQRRSEQIKQRVEIQNTAQNKKWGKPGSQEIKEMCRNQDFSGTKGREPRRERTDVE